MNKIRHYLILYTKFYKTVPGLVSFLAMGFLFAIDIGHLALSDGGSTVPVELLAQGLKLLITSFLIAYLVERLRHENSSSRKGMDLSKVVLSSIVKRTPTSGGEQVDVGLDQIRSEQAVLRIDVENLSRRILIVRSKIEHMLTSTTNKVP